MKRKEFYDRLLYGIVSINSRLDAMFNAIKKEKVHAFVVNVSDSPKKTESENEENATEETATEDTNENENVNESEPQSVCLLEEFQPFECPPGTVIDNTMIDATEDPELDVNAENG